MDHPLLPSEIWHHIIQYLRVEGREQTLTQREHFVNYIQDQLRFLSWKLDLLSGSISTTSVTLDRSIRCINESLFCPPHFSRMAHNLTKVSAELKYINAEYQESIREMRKLARVLDLMPPSSDETMLVDL